MYFNDTMSGSMSGLGAHLTARLETESVYFLRQAHTLQQKEGKVTGKFGAVQLVLYAHGNKRRVIDVINDDGRWKFGSSGKPLPFEDTRRYEVRDKKDCFTPATFAYLAELKSWPFDDGFFRIPTNNTRPRAWNWSCATRNYEKNSRPCRWPRHERYSALSIRVA